MPTAITKMIVFKERIPNYISGLFPCEGKVSTLNELFELPFVKKRIRYGTRSHGLIVTEISYNMKKYMYPDWSHVLLMVKFNPKTNELSHQWLAYLKTEEREWYFEIPLENPEGKQDKYILGDNPYPEMCIKSHNDLNRAE